MRVIFLSVLLYVQYGHCLWPNGVIHYVFNEKDYDVHSQDIITSTFEALERELCVKFFHSPTNKTGVVHRKLLYIANPDKMKLCPTQEYNYDADIIYMPIGYKCLNSKEVTRIIVDMLRASIKQSEPFTRVDIDKKYENNHQDSRTLLSPEDRNYINSHYYTECSTLSSRPVAGRRANKESVTMLSEFYKNLVWPLGVVMYTVEPSLRFTPENTILRNAMRAVESSTCLVFQCFTKTDVLRPKNLVIFNVTGEELPEFGFREGTQSINLKAMVLGARGHNAHAINNLLRLLGIPMMSNRFDRDNHITINWKYVQNGKEHLLEKLTDEAWVSDMPYDFNSVTHAPANFACSACDLGAHTVEPVQDHLWQRTMSMGHRTTLSESDIKFVNLIYGRQCQRRVS